MLGLRLLLVIAVFLGNDTDVPAFERYMQDTARLLV